MQEVTQYLQVKSIIKMQLINILSNVKNFKFNKCKKRNMLQFHIKI